jgi:cytochrome P450
MTDFRAGPGAPPGCPAHTPSAARLTGTDLERDPDAVYERLRERYGPVAPVELDRGVPAWLVMGYEEITSVVNAPDLFARHPKHWRELKEGRVPLDWPHMPVVAPQPNVSFEDGPEHARLRLAVTDALGKIQARTVRRYTEQAADRLIAAFAPEGRAELMTQYALTLPAMVTARLLGLPARQVPAITTAVTTMLNGGHDAIAADQQIKTTLGNLTAHKALSPGEDLVSWMLSGPGNLTQQEVADQAWILLPAGLETNQAWIGNTLRLILTSSLSTEVRGGRQTVTGALHRTLWTNPPVANFLGRYATADTHLGEFTVREGDLLIIGLAAATADPEIHPGQAADADNRSYPAFSFGPHACPARDLAEGIAKTGIEHLLRHVPGIRLDIPASDLEWRPSLFIRATKKLPVTFLPFDLAQAGALWQPSPPSSPSAPSPSRPWSWAAPAPGRPPSSIPPVTSER